MQSKRPVRTPHRLHPDVYRTPQYEFFFTVCARHQGAPFLNGALAKDVVDSLLWTAKKYEWYLFCYCLMPDHLHFVCRLSKEESEFINGGARGEIRPGVLEHLARFKSFTTHQGWKHGIKGELWQTSSYDRVLDLKRPFEEIVEYTLLNPVRRGLFARWEEWPYSRVVDRW
jgi:putative transposase